MRWNHPQHGLLLPGQFIALAEETGLIIPLGRMVLQTALLEAVRWQRDQHPRPQELHMAVNVSGRQLLDPGIVEEVASAIKDSRHRREAPSCSRSPRACCCPATGR